jgi:hypothetical protein
MASSGSGEYILQAVLEDLSPKAGREAIGRAAALIAEGTEKLPLTTNVTLREILLTWRASRILHASQEEPGPLHT